MGTAGVKIARDEFMRVVQMLKSNYRYPSFLGDQETIDFWYDTFQYCGKDELYSSVKTWINTRSDPPTIADIWDDIRSMRNRIKKYDPNQHTVRCTKCRDTGVIMWDDIDGRPWCRACDCEKGRSLTGLWKTG